MSGIWDDRLMNQMEEGEAMKKDECPGVTIEDVLASEFQELKSSRLIRLEADEIQAVEQYKSDEDAAPKDASSGCPPGHDTVYSQAHSQNFIGLAFSGGGIRSATFNLGIIQGLAELGFLRFFDYLSTVSGGGYIGSWLAGWISRSGSVRDVEKKICSRAQAACNFEKSREVSFLRKFSNYLTPKMGFFGADTWALISTYLRNLSLNLTVLIPLSFTILLCPAMVVWIFHLISYACKYHPAVVFETTVVFLSIAAFFISLNLSYQPHARPGKPTDPWYTRQGYILLVIVLPILISALFGSFSIWFSQKFDITYKLICLGLTILAYVLSNLAGLLTAHFLNNIRIREAGGKSTPHLGGAASDAAKTTVKRFNTIWALLFRKKAICSFSIGLSLAAGTGLVFFLNYLATLMPEDSTTLWHVMGFGMPLVVIVYMAVITLQMGFAGRDFPDEKREWWSRLGGWLFIFMLLWTGLFSLAIFAPALIVWASAYGSLSLGSGWLIASISGILAGKSPATGKGVSKPWIELLAKAAPYIFTAGLFFLFYFAAFIICIYVSKQWDGFWEALWASQNSFTGFVYANLYFADFILNIRLLCVFLASLLATILFSWRIDINQFSIHLLYRNRLIRCYLGATNQGRHPQPFTGFGAGDDLQLCELVHDGEYYGPYPIINSALNLVRVTNLAWQQRKATSFILSPKFSGYDLSLEAEGDASEGAYRPTSEYDNQRGLSLGEAMAISGAAASPNMGYHSSPPLAFLMTVFNVRLGWWSGNTRYEGPWKKASPDWGLRYLVSELFGLTDDRSKYVYLSDGGHFENLGIYELVRRRCRLIILSDGGCDPGRNFEDLGNAIRKIRVDLGVPIDIDLSLIRKKKSRCAKGTIRYKAVDGGAGVQNGILIYIKPVICGGEPADVSNYAATHKGFPHESTADQWFDEPQFESYRMLGLHSLREIWGDAPKGKTPLDLIKRVGDYLTERERMQTDKKKEA